MADEKKDTPRKKTGTKPKREVIPVPPAIPNLTLSEDDLDKFLMLLAYKLHGEIVKTERVDTGRLRASYVVEKEGYCSYLVGTTVEYGPNVEARFATNKNATSKLPQFAFDILGKRFKKPSTIKKLTS